MLAGQIVSLATTLLALATVCVAAWQVRVTTKSAERANALPIVSQIFQQWRSAEFNNSLKRLINIKQSYLSRENFNALPARLRRDAYEICYFFDYLGTLVYMIL